MSPSLSDLTDIMLDTALAGRDTAPVLVEAYQLHGALIFASKEKGGTWADPFDVATSHRERCMSQWREANVPSCDMPERLSALGRRLASGGRTGDRNFHGFRADVDGALFALRHAPHDTI
jgi:hypothetical protein